MTALVALSDPLFHFDEAVTDACDFLRISRSSFFQRARRHIDFLNQQSLQGRIVDPGVYYVNDAHDHQAGVLSSQVWLQSTPGLIWEALLRLEVSPGARCLDFGCGTAVPIFSQRHRFGPLFLCDVAPECRAFLAWRAARRQADNIEVILPSDLARLPQVQLLLALDVLEHIPESSAVFATLHRQLAPGGLLFLNAPWASKMQFPEHLPEAETDWLKPGGGADVLARDYDRLLPWPDGGVYRKRD